MKKVWWIEKSFYHKYLFIAIFFQTYFYERLFICIEYRMEKKTCTSLDVYIISILTLTRAAFCKFF